MGLAVALGVACSDGPGDDPTCETSTGPAYVVTVRAEDGPLPKDLVITAHFGGGEESFSLAEGPVGTGERIMFCDAERANDPTGLGGAGGHAVGLGGSSGHGPALHQGPVDALVCNLWADSAVTMRMTATGYEFDEQELKLEFDKCHDVVTTDVEATLVRPLPDE